MGPCKKVETGIQYLYIGFTILVLSKKKEEIKELMDILKYEEISKSVAKIRTYAELMVNVTPEQLEFDGNVMINMGAEIIEALNTIASATKELCKQ